MKKRNITDFGIISYECRSAENLIDGGDGVTIPPVVAQILSGDSTSPLTRDGHGCPKLNAQSFARMRNQQSVHMASVVVLFLG